MKKQPFFFCLLLLAYSCGLNGFVDHLCPWENIPSLVASYSITDMGETDIDPSRLTRATKKLSLAPRINENGVFTGNTSQGGFVTLLDCWYYAPRYEGMVVNFHAINERGDLLVAVNRGQESVEWMRWPCKEGNYGTARQHINTIDPFKAKFYVAGFNDESTVVGYGQSLDCALRPLSWSICEGLDRLGSAQGLDIQGNARGINNDGTVVGVLDTVSDQTPYVWNPYHGLLAMKNYHKLLDPTGWVEFADLLLTEDTTVYATYRIKHLAKTHVVRGHYYETRQSNGAYYDYSAFTWKPANGQIEMLDLQGMRLSAVNGKHVLVGSLLESAALCMQGKPPVLLSSLMNPDDVDGWDLLEITDINDQGQLVGYGWYENKIHLFMANPLN